MPAASTCLPPPHLQLWRMTCTLPPNTPWPHVGQTGGHGGELAGTELPASKNSLPSCTLTGNLFSVRTTISLPLVPYTFFFLLPPPPPIHGVAWRTLFCGMVTEKGGLVTTCLEETGGV